MNCSTPSGSDGHWDLDTERTANRSTGPPFIQLTKGNALDDFKGPAPPYGDPGQPGIYARHKKIRTRERPASNGIPKPGVMPL
ncbi:hypothetical protein [Synechococcus sp. MU1655]|uniref:hypothetical protein n=1 Tax=Synechococcus sp. MU1655 TaxID=2508355 RepID=UPI002026EB04|nr:hypothetical protein [Synechococcus sp. MU1655]